jgi:hypothetical protein
VHAGAEQPDRAAARLRPVEQRDGAARDVIGIARRRRRAVAARHGREIGVAYLDRHRPAEQPLLREPVGGGARHLVHDAAHLVETREVDGERRLRARGLRVVVRHDGAVVVAVGELSQPVGVAADRFAQARGIGRADVHEPRDPALAQARRRDGPHAPQRVDRQLLEERVDALGRDDREAVRLPPRRRDLGEELVGRHARRRGERRRGTDLRLQPARDLAPERLAPRVLGHVEVRLVERQRLDERCHRAEDREDGLRYGPVLLEVGPHDDQLRAETHRPRHRHRRPHPEAARLVAGRRDDAPARRAASDGHGTPRQGRIVPLLDRRVERIHVDVQDATIPDP